MTLRIPLAKPEITDADREAVMQVLQTPQLSFGPKVAEFEQAICDYTGRKYAVAVNSGTSALHLAVRALGLKAGDEVILPSFTFSALLNVILQEGLRPRFVDIDPATYNTTAELVAAAITERTHAIIAVHTFRFSCRCGSVAQCGAARRFAAGAAAAHDSFDRRFVRGAGSGGSWAQGGYDWRGRTVCVLSE